MPRYVNADTAPIYLNQQACEQIKRMPTADVAPVVHGHWIEKSWLIGTSRFCSVCDSNYGMPHEIYKYCPNCGARMDGKEEKSETY